MGVPLSYDIRSNTKPSAYPCRYACRASSTCATTTGGGGPCAFGGGGTCFKGIDDMDMDDDDASRGGEGDVDAMFTFFVGLLISKWKCVWSFSAKRRILRRSSGGIPVDLLGGSVAALIEFMLWCNFYVRTDCLALRRPPRLALPRLRLASPCPSPRHPRSHSLVATRRAIHSARPATPPS